jgi:biotin carboxyl carrier protein
VKKLGFKFDVITPFAGTIDRIYYAPGESVEEGATLLSLHSNGMVHQILSPVTGYLDSAEVSQGDFVISGMIVACMLEAEKKEEESAV